LKTVPFSNEHESRARELIADAFAGTPGRLRVFGAVAVASCLVFGVVGFLLVQHLDNSLGDERAHAAQLVRIQTIRTSLVAADANATNAFLVGGLEPADARAGYVDGINTAATTLAAASNADSGGGAELEAVNQVLTSYTGLIESARANNRQGFPIGAAYLRQASRSIRDDALPPLAELVQEERSRVENATSAATTAKNGVVTLLCLVLAALLITQLWLFGRTHRVLNGPLLLASVLVLLAGVVALATMGWSRNRELEARKGPYAQTVALATARIDGFDAKSDESLTLIAHGSGQEFEDRFKSVAVDARAALGRAVDTTTQSSFETYLARHRAVRAADDSGRYDDAVAMATGKGAANRAFGTFETESRDALTRQSTALSDDLAHARFPLLALSLMLLTAGLVAAVASRRGIAQRLQEYR
jgi:hypothetical protein